MIAKGILTLLVEQRGLELQFIEYPLNSEAPRPNLNYQPRPNHTRRWESVVCNNRIKLSQIWISVNKTKVSTEPFSTSTQPWFSVLEEENHHEYVLKKQFHEDLDRPSPRNTVLKNPAHNEHKHRCSTKIINIYAESQGRNVAQLLKGKTEHTVFCVVKPNATLQAPSKNA